jgi:hypothetical protein
MLIEQLDELDHVVRGHFSLLFIAVAGTLRRVSISGSPQKMAST